MGKTLLTVEHDMGVVFGLADKIAVVVYGEVIAFDTPEAVRANPRVQEAYLGSVLADAAGDGALSMTDAAASRTCTPTTARATCCTASTSKCGEGEIVALLGRNGSGRSTTAKAIMGLVRRHRLGGLARPATSSATKPYEIAHLGIGYVPENRDIFPKLTVHQNLHARPEARASRAALVIRRHVPDVPAPEGAPAHRGRRAVGRRAADADAVPHADGRPRPDHDRRAHRRAGAEDRRAGRAST